MQKFLLAAALLVATATGAQAQTNVLKVNIFSPLVKTGSFFFEHKLTESSSAQLGGLVTYWKVGDTKISGFALTPEYRMYLSEKKGALRGFYVAPYLRYQNLTLTVNETYDNGTVEMGKAKLNTYGGGVVAGYQLLLKDRFSLDFFLGPSYNGGDIKVESMGQSTTFDAGPFTGFGLRSGLTFGVAF
jgi:hypothetical protein